MFRAFNFRRLFTFTRVQISAVLVAALSITVAPAIAIDGETTTVTVNATFSRDGVAEQNPDLNRLYINVIAGEESVWFTSADSEDGQHFAFTDVPVLPDAEYFVWLGSFDEPVPGYLRVGDTMFLPDGTEVNEGLLVSWVGLESSPDPINLALESLDSGIGSICGSVVDLDADDALAGVTITATSNATIDGVKYIFNSRAAADVNGEYCFDNLVLGHSYQVSFDPWMQSDSTYSDANYRNASENVRVRESAPERTLTLYTKTEPNGEVTGDLSYSLTFVDPDGSPVSTSEFQIELWGIGGGVGGYSGSGNEATFDSLTAGNYQVNISDIDAGFRIAKMSTQISVSGEMGAENASEIVVYPVAAGSASISGQFNWAIDTEILTNSWVGLRAIDLATPWDLPDGVTFDSYAEVALGEDGTWTFTGLPAGEYRITYPFLNDEGTGQAWRSLESEIVTVADGQVVDLGIQSPELVESDGDTLVVKVKNSASRAPIEGVNCGVQIYDEIHTYATAQTDANGIAIFNNLFRGYTYDVRCNSWGEVWGIGGRARAVTIAAGVNNYIVPMETYDANAHASGRVVDSDGNPLEGIRVSAQQTWAYPDCECGDGFSVSDITDSDGRFQLDNFVIGREVQMDVTDRSEVLASTVFVYRADSSENVDLGDLTLRPGADVGGFVGDSTDLPVTADIILIDTSQGNRIYGRTNELGEIEFTVPVPIGTYKAFVATSWSNSAQQEQGFITESGSLTLAESDAATFAVSTPGELTVLPDVTSDAGGAISGRANFVDGEGNPITGSRLDARARLWVQSTGGGWERVEMPTGWASSEMNSEFSIAGLPAGNYKVCLSDYYTTINRFDEVCNGGESRADAAPLELNHGESIANVNVDLSFRQPDVAPQPVSLDELDPDLYLALEDQIQVISRNTGETVIQVDPDLAGQWVAAQLAPDAQSAPVVLNGLQSRQSASFNTLFNRTLSVSVTSWLQVAADGIVTIPSSMMAADQQGQIALLGFENNVLGWTDLSASNGGGSGGSGGGNGSNASSDESVETAELTAISDTPVETSASGGVEVQNAAGPEIVVETPAALMITVGLLILAIVGGSAVAVRRGRARNQ